MLTLTEFSWLINILIGGLLGWSEAASHNASFSFTIEALLVGLLFGVGCGYGSNRVSYIIATCDKMPKGTKAVVGVIWPILGIIITLFLGILVAKLIFLI